MDKLNLGGRLFDSRFIMGSGKFDPELITACIEEANAQIITLAIRRVNKDSDISITKFIPQNITLLPNTSGARDYSSGEVWRKPHDPKNVLSYGHKYDELLKKIVEFNKKGKIWKQ